MSTMSNALLITLIGMGLVFVVIILLWGLMAALMRLTAKSAQKEAKEGGEDDGDEAGEESASVEAGVKGDKARVAAAAVAIALLRRPRGSFRLDQVSETGSAWQTVQRANMMHDRANIRIRK